MKKLYRIIPLILIFVMLFSIPVYATESKNETPMYSSIYDEYVEICLEAAINKYLNEIGGERKDLFVYAQTQASPSTNLPLYVYIGIRSNITINAPSSSVSVSGSLVQYDVRYNYSGAYIIVLNQYATPASVSFTTNGHVKYKFCYVSENIYNDTGTLLYKCDKPLVEDAEDAEDDKTGPTLNYDFMKDLEKFEDYADYLEHSQNYHDTVISSKQDIIENENNPNDDVFANIWSAMTGSMHVNNQIVQQISAQINQFAEGVFKPFANYCLNLLMNIVDAIGALGGMFEEFSDFMNKLYSLGLDDTGFSLDSFFLNLGTLLFVPEDNYVENKLETFYFEKFGFIELGYSFLDSVKAALSQTDTVMPVFTTDSYTWNDVVIPSFTIDFSFYEKIKPYADPLVSAFCWITFVWKVIVGFPSLLRGGNVLSGASFIATDIERSNIASSDAEKIARNYGWK